MLKDELLDKLASEGGNVAQFISFGPDGNQRFCRINGIDPNHNFENIISAANALMSGSGTGRINIRTFLPDKPDGNPFKYGLHDIGEACEMALNFSKQGFYVVLNENISITDGGFSGVIFGSLIEGAGRYSQMR
jgi:hypothetical protein